MPSPNFCPCAAFDVGSRSAVTVLRTTSVLLGGIDRVAAPGPVVTPGGALRVVLGEGGPVVAGVVEGVGCWARVVDEVPCAWD